MTTTEVALPGQAGELNSVDQLEADEAAAVRLRRAHRVMKKPQQLARLAPEEQLAECLKVLHAAEERREGTVKEAQLRAGAVFFDTAGPYLMWVRDNGLYCLDDPECTFERWLGMVWGYSPSQCYLFMDAVRVRIALGLAGSDEYAYNGTALTTKHIRALAPVVNAELPAGDVRQVWADTETRDVKVTEQGLRTSYRELAAAKTVPAPGDSAETIDPSKSNNSFDFSDRSEESNESADVERLERWGVNEKLRAIRAELESLQQQFAKLTEDGMAPLDAADAEREAKQVRALGRWFSQHGSVPVDAVVDAEIVES